MGDQVPSWVGEAYPEKVLYWKLRPGAAITCHLSIPKLEAPVDQYRKLAGNNLRSKRGLDVMIHADLWYNNMMFKDGDSPSAEEVKV